MTRKQNISNEPVYTISIAAKKLGVSVHSLRLYEREGLIRPFRTETNRRLYSDIELRKVTALKYMVREKGMNFEGLRRLVALIPCHKLNKDCTKVLREDCPAHKGMEGPCWSYESACAALNDGDNCRDCQVYLGTLDFGDVQRMIVH